MRHLTGLRVGVDIVQISRIQGVYERNPQAFLHKLFTKIEQNAFEQIAPKRRFTYLAGRYALKEAVAKATGVGLWGEAGLSFHDIVIQTDTWGAPLVTLSQTAKARLYGTADVQLSASISHDGDLAFAECIIWSQEQR